MNHSNHGWFATITPVLIGIICTGCPAPKNAEEPVVRGVVNAAHQAKHREERSWTLPATNSQVLDIQTGNGGIKVYGQAEAKTAEVKAIIEVRAPSSEQARAFAQQIKVTVESAGEVLRARREYPKPPDRVNVSVSFEIAGPSGLDAMLRTKNGSIEARRLTGDLTVSTSNGSVSAQQLRGSIDAKTSNGSIEIRQAVLTESGRFETSNGRIAVALDDATAPLSAITANGAIELRLPPGFSGRLDARTVNGRITVRPDQSQLQRNPRGTEVRGPLGAGSDKHPVQLRTSNGSILLNIGK